MRNFDLGDRYREGIPKRVLVVHEVSYFSKPIFEFQEIPELLLDLGMAVAIYDLPESSERKSLAPRGTLVPSRLRRGSVKHFPSLFRDGLFGRAAGLVFSFFEALIVIKSFKPDLILNYAVATNGLGAALAAKCSRTRFLYRAIDASAELRNLPALRLLIRTLEGAVSALSDSVVVHNQTLSERITRLPIARRRAIRQDLLLPPLSGDDYQSTGEQISDRVSGKPRVVFVGTFFRFSGLLELVRSLDQPVSNSVDLFLYGDGENFEAVKAEVRRRGLDEKVHLPGFIPFAEMAEALSKADICINPMVPCEATHNALPNKVLQYLLAGKKVVSTQLTGLESVVGDSKLIRFVNKPEEVLETALQFYHSEISAEQTAIAVRDIEQKLSPENFLRNLVAILARS